MSKIIPRVSKLWLKTRDISSHIKIYRSASQTKIHCTDMMFVFMVRLNCNSLTFLIGFCYRLKKLHLLLRIQNKNVCCILQKLEVPISRKKLKLLYNIKRDSHRIFNKCRSGHNEILNFPWNRILFKFYKIPLVKIIFYVPYLCRYNHENIP